MLVILSQPPTSHNYWLTLKKNVIKFCDEQQHQRKIWQQRNQDPYPHGMLYYTHNNYWIVVDAEKRWNHGINQKKQNSFTCSRKNYSVGAGKKGNNINAKLLD